MVERLTSSYIYPVICLFCRKYKMKLRERFPSNHLSLWRVVSVFVLSGLNLVVLE